MVVEIWHNPRCSKSRQTLALLEERGVELKVVEYLQSPPSAERLAEVLALLQLEPLELMRKKEAPFAELGLADSASRAELIAAMVAHPVLIERPVVIAGNKAALGRPPESVLDIL